jgi:hypothetical protein
MPMEMSMYKKTPAGARTLFVTLPIGSGDFSLAISGTDLYVLAKSRH